MKINRDAVDSFTHHINNIDDNIKFTCLWPRKRLSAPISGYLDHQEIQRYYESLDLPQSNTHTDQYLDFQSHHPLEHKVSVVRTLMHRVETTVTEPTDLSVEKDHTKSALIRTGFSSGLARTFPGGRAAHPEIQNEEENEERLRKNKRTYKKLKKNWENVLVLPTREWEAGYGPGVFSVIGRLIRHLKPFISGGGRTRLPKFKFSAKFPIGLHVIL